LPPRADEEKGFREERAGPKRRSTAPRRGRDPPRLVRWRCVCLHARGPRSAERHLRPRALGRVLLRRAACVSPRAREKRHPLVHAPVPKPQQVSEAHSLWRGILRVRELGKIDA